MPSLGIDIGGTSVKVAFIDGDVVRTDRSSVYQHPGRDELTRAVREAVDSLGASIDASTSVGLCLPGRQDEAGTRVVESVNLSCLNDWVFETLLAECLGSLPNQWRVVRDIHATGINLIRKNNLAGRVAVMAIGTGVGVMVFDNGEPIEIESLSGFGQRELLHGNTLEACVGVNALRTAAGSRDEQVIESHIESCSAKSLFMQAMGEAMCVVESSANPDVIVLAGGVGIALCPRASELAEFVSCDVEFGDSLYHAASGAALLALG